MVEAKYKDNAVFTTEDAKFAFKKDFLKNLQELRDKDVELKSNMISDMLGQAKDIIPHIMPSLEEYFGKFELVATEESLFEEIDDSDLMYKGFVDLVVKTEDGKYHIIDWKTCSWGWDARRKSEKMVTYQLTFYKYFFARKYGIDLADIETHFALLKRTAKKNRVEFFRVSSGNKKTDNAVNFLSKALYNIDKETFIKNRLSCARCEFYKTENCP